MSIGPSRQVVGIQLSKGLKCPLERSYHGWKAICVQETHQLVGQEKAAHPAVQEAGLSPAADVTTGYGCEMDQGCLLCSIHGFVGYQQPDGIDSHNIKMMDFF